MSTDPNAVFRSVAAAFQAGDFDAAARHLSALADDPNAPQSTRDRGTYAAARAHLLREATQEAIDTLAPLLTRIDTLPPALAADVWRLKADLAVASQEPLQELAGHLQRAARLDREADQTPQRAESISRSVEILLSLRDFRQAQQLLKNLLGDAPDLDPNLRLLFRLQHAVIGLLDHQPGAQQRTDERLRDLDHNAQHASVHAGRVLYARALLQLGRPSDAIAVLNGARQRAVQLADPVRYLVVASLLAQAYENNHQRPEAYGTLLRARVSLHDLLGDVGSQMPQIMLNHMIERWGEDAEDIIETFHSRYQIPR